MNTDKIKFNQINVKKKTKEKIYDDDTGKRKI